MEIKEDCRFYVGYKPCRYHKSHGAECDSCSFYDPINKKIFIINLVGIGDVLRTTSVLKPLKEKYPHAKITFLTSKKGFDLLKNNPLIDDPLILNFENSLRLQIEKFDLLANLDKSHEAAAIASLIKANKKLGFGLNEKGCIFPYNKAAQYLMDIGLSDKLKIANKKSPQNMFFEVLELEYQHIKPILPLSKEAVDFSKDFFKKNSISEKDLVIGFTTGCSGRIFPNRKWPVSRFVELAELLHNGLNSKILLFGGPEEIERNKEIIKQASHSSVPIVDTGNNNPIEHFAALISKCSIIVAGDTSAVHIAVALNVPVIALLGPTSTVEIELYDLGKKIMSDIECAPCYKHACDKEVACMHKITAKQVYNAIVELLKNK